MDFLKFNRLQSKGKRSNGKTLTTFRVGAEPRRITYVPCSNGEKSILLNFGRKKILKIGKCREFYSEQLLYLKLLLKRNSYSSGNQRNFGKVYGFTNLCRHFKSKRLFQFSFKFHFFRVLQTSKLFQPIYRLIFLIFCLTLQENRLFYAKNS